MVSNRQRRKSLARAKWQRQQYRRTAAQQRTRTLSIIFGTVAAVVVVVAIGWGGYLIFQSNNSTQPSQQTPTDNFPSLLTPTNPGITVTSFNSVPPSQPPATSGPTPTGPEPTSATGSAP